MMYDDLEREVYDAAQALVADTGDRDLTLTEARAVWTAAGMQVQAVCLTEPDGDVVRVTREPDGSVCVAVQRDGHTYSKRHPESVAAAWALLVRVGVWRD